jgi:hypothetical protein
MVKTLTHICAFKLKTLQKCCRRVWPHKGVAEILLQHNNAPPHISFKTQEAITKLGWTVLSQPPNSPDLVPSDFHLSAALKDDIHGKGFGVTMRLLKVWLWALHSNWYKNWTEALVAHWHKTVEVDGVYIEMWCVIQPSCYPMNIFKELYNKLLAIEKMGNFHIKFTHS